MDIKKLEELERKIKELEPIFQKVELEVMVLKRQIKQLETRIRDANKPDFDLEKLWEIHHFKPKKEKTP